MELEEQVTVHVKEEVGEDETDSALVIRCDNEDSSSDREDAAQHLLQLHGSTTDQEDAAQHLLTFVNLQPKLPVLKPKVRIKSPSSMRDPPSSPSSIRMREIPSMAPAGPGSTGLFPPTEPWPGEYDFKLVIAEDMTKSSKKYHYNPALNKLYADMGAVINFQLHITGSLPPGTVVRATLVYKSHNDRSKPVLRCPNHSSPKDPSNMDHPEWTWPHVLRCLNDFNSALGVQYYTNPESGRLSVLAGLDATVPGCKYFTKLYKFVCLGSCVGGIARRPLMLVATLEDGGGEVIGRQTIDVRLCTCPLRDHNQDQAKLIEKKESKQKAKVSKEKELGGGGASRFAASTQMNSSSGQEMSSLVFEQDTEGTVRLMSQYQPDNSVNRCFEEARVGEATRRFREENPSASQIYWVPVHNADNFKAVNKFAEYLDMTSGVNRGEGFKKMRNDLVEAVNNLGEANDEQPMMNGVRGNGVNSGVKLANTCLAPRVQEFSKSILKTTAPSANILRTIVPNSSSSTLRTIAPSTSASILRAIAPSTGILRTLAVVPSSSTNMRLPNLQNVITNKPVVPANIIKVSSSPASLVRTSTGLSSSSSPGISSSAPPAPLARTSTAPASFVFNPSEKRKQETNMDATIEFKSCSSSGGENGSVTVLGKRSELGWNGMNSSIKSEPSDLSKPGGSAQAIKIELKDPLPGSSSGKRSWFLENAGAIVASSKRTKLSEGDMVIVHNSDYLDSIPESPPDRSERTVVTTASPDSIRILESKKVRESSVLKVEAGEEEEDESNEEGKELKQPGATFLTYRDNSFVQNSALDGSDSEDRLIIDI